MRTEADELAQVRCKLSRARLDFQIWNRTGQRPQGAGFVRLCSPQPGRPLTLWTFGGFGPNGARLNPNQLKEIELIAGGLARNPRTRAGLPVLTITVGFAPSESPSVGDARAIAVKNALLDALKRIDPPKTYRPRTKRTLSSLTSIRRCRLERRGPQFIKVGSLVRYRPEDLETWLASLPTGGSRPLQTETATASAQRNGHAKVMS